MRNTMQLWGYYLNHRSHDTDPRHYAPPEYWTAESLHTSEVFWRIPHNRAIAQHRPDVAGRYLVGHALRLYLLPFHHEPTAEQILKIRTGSGSYRLDFQQQPAPLSRLGITKHELDTAHSHHPVPTPHVVRRYVGRF
jgi:hypothetical protein